MIVVIGVAVYLALVLLLAVALARAASKPTKAPPAPVRLDSTDAVRQASADTLALISNPAVVSSAT